MRILNMLGWPIACAVFFAVWFAAYGGNAATVAVGFAIGWMWGLICEFTIDPIIERLFGDDGLIFDMRDAYRKQSARYSREMRTRDHATRVRVTNPSRRLRRRGAKPRLRGTVVSYTN